MRFSVCRLCLPPWLAQVEENLATRSGLQTSFPSTQGGWRPKERCLPPWLVQVEANLATRSGLQTSFPSTQGGWRPKERCLPPWLVQVEEKFGNQISSPNVASIHTRWLASGKTPPSAFHPGLPRWRRIWKPDRRRFHPHKVAGERCL